VSTYGGDGVVAIRWLLVNAAEITAIVPADWINGGLIPQGAVLPAIAITSVSKSERTTVAMNEAQVLITELVQVTVHSRVYSEAKHLLELIRRACANYRGTLNGVLVDSILPEGAGPDLRDDDTRVFAQSRDFTVRYAVPLS
jgi:hypothetical protein